MQSLFYKIAMNVINRHYDIKYVPYFAQFKNNGFEEFKLWKNNQTRHLIVFKTFYMKFENTKNKDEQNILEIYIKSKRIYNILSRIVYKYKLKKAIIYDNKEDLFFNKLSLLPAMQKIFIFQNNTIYNFRLTDLINIIKESLTNCDGLFPTPQVPKNPYTNIAFNKVHLINIFMKLKYSYFNLPIILRLFFKTHFNIRKLKYLHYPFLKENSLNKFPQNCNNLFFEITDMIDELSDRIHYIYDDTSQIGSMDKQNFINDFKPLLVSWLKSKYSTNPNIRGYNKSHIVADIKLLLKKKEYIFIKKQTISLDNMDTISNLTTIFPDNVTTSNIVLTYNQRNVPPLLRPLLRPLVVEERVNVETYINSTEVVDVFRTNDVIPRSPVNRQNFNLFPNIFSRNNIGMNFNRR
tara:strand:- start:60 stop:1280 length:1221 start_codon:yes stop_codon:yes gene_type:complete